jgi:putative transcriptional regulator
MAIVIILDVILAKRKMSMTGFSDKVGITTANLWVLNSTRARAVRFSTLEALCRILNCQPGDLLEYRQDAPQI